MGRIVTPSPNFNVVTLNPNALRKKAFREVIRVKGDHKNEALIQQDSCPCKRRKRQQAHVCTEERLWEDRRWSPANQRQGLRRNQAYHTLIFNSQPSEL